MKIRKHSRQRDAILKNLSSRLDHPTADMIYRDLREEYPRISLGTVYRNLNLLAELGQIRKIHCEGGTEHYDYDTSDHCHFVCKQRRESGLSSAMPSCFTVFAAAVRRLQRGRSPGDE